MDVSGQTAFYEITSPGPCLADPCSSAATANVERLDHIQPPGIYDPQVERAVDIDIAVTPLGKDDRFERQLLSPFIW